MAEERRDEQRGASAGGWLPPEPPGAPPPEEMWPYGSSQPPPGAYQQPQGGWAPPYARQGHAVQEPGNNEAVVALILGIVGLVMLFLFIFIIPLLIALPCAIAAIFVGRKGKRKVDRGETRRHRGLAQAGFIMGLIGAPLSVLGIIGWTLLIVLSDDFQAQFESEFEEQLEEGGGVSVALRAGAALVRLVVG